MRARDAGAYDFRGTEDVDRRCLVREQVDDDAEREPQVGEREP